MPGKTQWKINVRYYLTIQNNPRGEIKVSLPTGGDEYYIVQELVAPSVMLLGDLLGPTWGGRDEKDSRWRIYLTTVEGGDWDDVRDAVDAKVSEIMETVKGVVDVNKELLATKPNDVELVFDVD